MKDSYTAIRKKCAGLIRCRTVYPGHDLQAEILQISSRLAALGQSKERKIKRKARSR